MPTLWQAGLQTSWSQSKKPCTWPEDSSDHIWKVLRKPIVDLIIHRTLYPQMILEQIMDTESSLYFLWKRFIENLSGKNFLHSVKIHTTLWKQLVIHKIFHPYYLMLRICKSVQYMSWMWAFLATEEGQERRGSSNCIPTSAEKATRCKRQVARQHALPNSSSTADLFPRKTTRDKCLERHSLSPLASLRTCFEELSLKALENHPYTSNSNWYLR